MKKLKAKKITVSKKEDTSKSEYINIEDTAVLEYLDTVKNEYQIERDKKQSFENRAGLIITILAAICIFLFEKISLSDIITLMVAPITFLVLIKIITGICVYIAFLFTIIMVYRTISTRKHDNFEVANINEQLLSENRLTALIRIVFTYRDIIVQHRTANEKRASSFKKSLLGIILTIICTIVYISI